MPAETTILWFGQDLRLDDHPALYQAARRGPVVPLFIWAPEEEGAWPPGAASRWWLHQSLTRLDQQLRQLGSRLILRRGPTRAALLDVARQCGATAVYWSKRYEPAAVERDKDLERRLAGSGLAVKRFDGALLHQPSAVATKGGGPFKVFTPFWKHCLAKGAPAPPLPRPASVPRPATWPRSQSLQSFALEPRLDWAAGFGRAWTPGSAGAARQLDRFVATALQEYGERRDWMDGEGLSRLSPHLHFGEISPSQVWAAVEESGLAERAAFLRQLGWREFAHHLLYHFPDTVDKPLRPAFTAFPWQADAAGLGRWQKGRTGVPLVDAAMIHLWREGWMPNRARMVVASYLCKNLLVDWRAGAAWFWDTLVDADLANNTLGWQWTAGCGADAAPYFRVFNPVRQAEKFDADGAYIRRWLPELARVQTPWVFKPWQSPDAVRQQIGAAYPQPLVDLGFSRQRALEAYRQMKQGQGK